jgi:hypothetical protein
MLLARTPALVHLVFGVAATRRFAPSRVEVHTQSRRLVHGSGWEEAEFEPGTRLTLSGLQRLWRPAATLQSWLNTVAYAQFEPDAPMSFLKDTWAAFQHPEGGLVRTRCHYAPMPVWLNGVCINRPFFGLAAIPYQDGEGIDILPGSGLMSERVQRYLLASRYGPDLLAGPRANLAGCSEWHTLHEDGHTTRVAGVSQPGNVALPHHPEVPHLRLNEAPMVPCVALFGGIPGRMPMGGCILWVKDGVLLHRTPGKWGGTVVAVASARELTTDLSQFGLVENEAYARMLGLLRETVARMARGD